MSTIYSKADKYAFSAPGTAYPTTGNLDFQMKNPGLLQLKVVNLGAEQYDPAISGNDLTFKLQDSDDGVTWADVGGITGVIKPMGELPFNARVRPYWRILAHGQAEGELVVSVDETLDLRKV